MKTGSTRRPQTSAEAADPAFLNHPFPATVKFGKIAGIVPFFQWKSSLKKFVYSNHHQNLINCCYTTSRYSDNVEILKELFRLILSCLSNTGVKSSARTLRVFKKPGVRQVLKRVPIPRYLCGSYFAVDICKYCCIVPR